MRVRYYCGECLTTKDFAPPLGEPRDCACSKCGKAFQADFQGAGAEALERCAFCGNRAFFVQKDFDQRLGCLIMGVALGVALLAGWRFGWIYFTPVLMATVLVDWIAATRIRPVTICYRCNAEYRDVPPDSSHKAYDPHIAERFAETKTVRRMR